MSKYYTPSIEEFHVGFEFERWIPKYGWAADDYSVGKFHPYTFRDGEAAEQYVDSDMARVKHLDREDIESFGFEYKGKTKQGMSDFDYTKIVKDAFSTQTIHLHHRVGNEHQNSIIWLHQDGNESYGVIAKFDDVWHSKMHIKNKSELGRILKQLGYEV